MTKNKIENTVLKFTSHQMSASYSKTNIEKLLKLINTLTISKNKYSKWIILVSLK